MTGMAAGGSNPATLPYRPPTRRVVGFSASRPTPKTIAIRAVRDSQRSVRLHLDGGSGVSSCVAHGSRARCSRAIPQPH